MTAAITILCVIAHIVANYQKKLAFQKIEKSVTTTLEVEKENAKQVHNSFIHSFINLPCRKNFFCRFFQKKLHMWCRKTCEIQEVFLKFLSSENFMSRGSKMLGKLLY